nr:RING finger protein 112-like isoform X2 [Chrysemys picta bellii]
MAEIVEAARREYEQFVQKQDRDHQSTSSCLRVKPAKMKQLLEGKHQELLERCRGELRGEDPQKQAALEELKQELDRQMDQFLSAYGQRFKMAVTKANRRTVEAARREYKQFVQEQVSTEELWVRIKGHRQSWASGGLQVWSEGHP